MAPINAALLGCGLFSQEVYARLLIEFNGRLVLKAAWSRTEGSAAGFVAKHAPSAAALHGDVGLADIMSDPDLALVIVVLPVQAALQAVQAALSAGKHVIEEKPVAPSVHAALKAIEAYRMAPPRGLWMMAENYRYEAVFLEAAQVIASGVLGDIIKMDLVADMPMNAENKYFSSPWRRDVTGCPGGQIMESSVHFLAALRLMARAAGLGEASQACAFARQACPDLSPPDTLVGCVTFPRPAAADTQGPQAPVAATVSISLAAAQVRWSLSVVGTVGSLEALRGGWEGVRSAYTLNMQVGKQPVSSKKLGFSGTSREMGSFLHLIDSWPPVTHDTSTTDPAAAAAGGELGTSQDPLFAGTCSSLPELLARSSPEEGARDLAVVEALLQSSTQGGQPTAVVQVHGPEMYSKA